MTGNRLTDAGSGLKSNWNGVWGFPRADVGRIVKENIKRWYILMLFCCLDVNGCWSLASESVDFIISKFSFNTGSMKKQK